MEGRQNFSRGLTLRYSIALSLIATLITISFVALEISITRQERTASIINISGRQRMLSQRIVLFSEVLLSSEYSEHRQEHSEKLKTAIDLMELSHDNLTGVSGELGLDIPMSDKLKGLYFEQPYDVDLTIRNFIRNSRELLDLPQEEYSSSLPQLAVVHETGTVELLLSLDRLVAQYQIEGENSIARIALIETLVWVLALSLLVAEVFVIFRPAVRSIAHHVDALKASEEIIRRQSKRMEDELQQGHDLQQSLLPHEFIDRSQNLGISLYASMAPATEVAGDFYDFMFLDDDHICFCVGDVSGKGVPAALFMAVSKALLRSRASHDASTASILSHVNTELELRNESMMFVTVFLAILDIRTGSLRFTNAGHTPSLVLKTDGTILALDQIDGAAAGVMPDLVYTEQCVTLERNDRLIVYTDGITEAINREEELFGHENLINCVREREYSSCEDLAQSVRERVGEFELGTEQADDITLLVLELNNEPVPTPA